MNGAHALHWAAVPPALRRDKKQQRRVRASRNMPDVYARCSGAVGGSATGRRYSDLKPSDSGSQKSAGWTQSALAVPPRPASTEQNPYFLPAACAAAAVSIGFNIWRFIVDRQRDSTARNTTALALAGTDIAALQLLQNKKVVVSEEWDGVAPAAELSSTVPLPRSLGDMEPLFSTAFGSARSIPTAFLPIPLDYSCCRLTTAFGSLPARLPAGSSAPSWRALPPPQQDYAGPASSSTNEEDLVLDGSTSGARVSRAGEAAYREVLASEADSDVIDTSLVLEPLFAFDAPSAASEKPEPASASFDLASFASASSDSDLSLLAAAFAPADRGLAATASAISDEPATASPSAFFPSGSEDDNSDDEISAMFEEAARRLSGTTLEVGPSDAGPVDTTWGVPPAEGSAEPSADLQDSFRQRLRASAQRAAEEMSSPMGQSLLLDDGAEATASLLLGPDTFHPGGGADAIEAKWQGLAAEILQNVREKTRAAAAATTGVGEEEGAARRGSN